MKNLFRYRNGSIVLWNLQNTYRIDKSVKFKFHELKIFLFSYLITVCIGCRKFVEINPPPTKPDASVVYGNDATATAVLTGLYNGMASNNNFATGVSGVSLIAGLSADELNAYSSSGALRIQAYSNSLTSAASPGVPFWSLLYSNVYTTNTALEGLANSKALSSAVKQQLTGEAEFMRAFFYFYLVNFWGDVPLITTTDFQKNSLAGRTAKEQVWRQIIDDLKNSQLLLANNFVALDLVTTTSERVRPNKWAATAMLARAYLYTNKYDSAEMQATAVIGNSSLFDTVGISNVFKMNTKETILQLQPVVVGWNTEDARAFILTGAPSSSQPVSINSNLLNAFELGDKRRLNWINSITIGTNTYYYPFKYQSATQNLAITEYLMVLRLGEQYLIRAEARAQQNNITGAQSDLNVIRKRAGLSNTIANDKASLLAAIEQERRVELFTEWGHRWLDLKRMNQVDVVMNSITLQKGGAWNTNWQLYPIPIGDILKDPSLTGQQNPGY